MKRDTCVAELKLCTRMQDSHAQCTLYMLFYSNETRYTHGQCFANYAQMILRITNIFCASDSQLIETMLYIVKRGVYSF